MTYYTYSARTIANSSQFRDDINKGLSMFFKSSNIRPMTNDTIMRQAPAVFAERPHSQTSYGKDSSNSYLFLPTISLVDGLRNNGWEVVAANQSGNSASSLEAKMTNKHALFFARRDALGSSFNSGDVMPLIKVENSHNGLSSFSLSTGFFRKICANGLTVPESIYAAPKVKHTLNLRDDVIEATYKVMNDFPMLMEMQKALSGIQLSHEEKMLVGDVAADIFFDKADRDLLNNLSKAKRDDRFLLESQLTTARRYDDRKMDLWTVSNVIQENLIRGNVQTAREEVNRYNGGKQWALRSQRKVTSIDRDNDIHEKLFKIIQHFAKERGVLIGAVA